MKSDELTEACLIGQFASQVSPAYRDDLGPQHLAGRDRPQITHDPQPGLDRRVDSHADDVAEDGHPARRPRKRGGVHGLIQTRRAAAPGAPPYRLAPRTPPN